MLAAEESIHQCNYANRVSSIGMPLLSDKSLMGDDAASAIVGAARMRVVIDTLTDFARSDKNLVTVEIESR